MDQHNAALSLITAKIKSFHATQTPYRISHGSTNSTRPKATTSSSSSPTAFLDTSPLSNILSISPLTLTTIVEPNVSMETLAAATLPFSLIPAIVPEFPSITVGGAYSGTAAESSSFKYGYFDRVVNWVEMVVADGKVVRAEREGENRDLFNGAAGALGTLGVVTLLEVRLVKVTKYVEVEYVPVLGVQEMLREVGERGKEEGVCFLDAVLFSRVSGVVVLGRCEREEEEESTSISTSKTKTKAQKSKTGQEEKSNLPVVHFSRAKDPWFCLHAHGKVTHPCNTHCIICKWTHTLPDHLDIGDEKKEMKELVPVKDYLFRYDRGAFWMGCYGWENAGLPFNRFTRWLLDGVFRTRMLYRIMHNSPKPPSFIIQDLAIPTEHAAAFLTFNDDELKIYPIWLCPIRDGSPALLHTAKSYSPPSPSPPSIPSTSNPLSSSLNPSSLSPPSLTPTNTNTITNIGLWGLPHLGLVPFTPSNYHSFITLNHAIETKVQEMKGLKWLYAHNYFSEGQFWKNYDKEGYVALRRKWGAEGGLSLWDKVGRKGGEGKGGDGGEGGENEGNEGEGVEVVGLMGLVRAVWGVLVVGTGGDGKKGGGKGKGEKKDGGE